MIAKKNVVAKTINENRAYLLIAIMCGMGLFAKNYFSAYNIKSMLDATVLYALIGISFTICLIAGHMDLSVGALANVGAVMVMGFHSLQKMPWWLAIICALLLGTAFGVMNGLFISKAKIHSFIVTLGVQFVIKGFLYTYTSGAEVGAKNDYVLSDWLNKFLKPLPFTPKFLITIAVVILLAIILKNTRFGRNLYIMGGNRETAWLGGINADSVTIVTFAMSGFMSALGGVMFAIAQASATPNMGEKGVAPLLVALAATIIGGTATDGGRGSVWKTFVAVLGLMAMFNVLTALVGKYEIQILSNGIVLAAVVLYETITNFYAKKKIGIRSQLVHEYEQKAKSHEQKA
jgi:ribose/xylose/arabinose/galactoside ABC-type transport system permease subunit